MSDARSIHRRLMDEQRAWADAHGFELASDTSLTHWRDNWLAPVSWDDERVLDPAEGARSDEPEKPGRLHDLGSGLALAHNVFGPWQGRESGLAKGVPWLCDEEARIRFAVSLGRISPADRSERVADVVIAGGRTPPTLIVPLYCEPFGDIDPRAGDPLGRDASAFGELHGCGLLARDLHCHPRRFARLDAGRVLELALAGTRRFGRHGFRIAVIWFDAGGRAGSRLHGECARLRMRIGGEVDLIEATWQEILAALASSGPEGAATLHRIRARYEPGASEAAALGKVARVAPAMRPTARGTT